MAINELRWHLVKEMSEILVTKLQRQEVYNHFANDLYYERKYCWKITPLTILLLSGTGPAEAVRQIVSPDVILIDQYDNQYELKIEWNKHIWYIETGYFKRLVLRWARFIDLYNRPFNDSLNPRYLVTLRNNNSVEKLRFTNYLNVSTTAAPAVIKACPNLSTLVGDDPFFSTLLKRTDVNLTKIRSFEIFDLEIDDDEPFACKRSFETLANHPERFPLFETLTVSTMHFLFNLPKCMPRNPFRTVKSLNIKVDESIRTSSDFSRVPIVLKAFPNVKNVCLTLSTKCEDGHGYEENMKLVRTFNDFKSDFKFEFNFNLKFLKAFRKDSEVQAAYKKLETVMSAYGTNDSIVKESRCVKYEATKSYPNKTLVFKLKACFRRYGTRNRQAVYATDDSSSFGDSGDDLGCQNLRNYGGDLGF